MQQYKKDQNFELITELWLLILRGCGIELKYLKFWNYF